MAKDRIKVWVQSFKDRPYPMLQWLDPTSGKRKSISAGTADEKEIERRRADKEYEIAHGLHVEPSKMTWADFEEIYLREKWAGATITAREKVAYVFRSFFQRVRPKNLGAINERIISAYATKLREEGKSPATIHGYLAYIKAGLRWANAQGIISSVPKFVMPRLPKGTNRVKIRNASRLTTEEFERLLQACPNSSWRLLIAFAWHCGMRRNEAMQVRGEHIDLERHVIEIPCNKAQDKAATAFITPDLQSLLDRMFPDGIPRGRLVTEVSTSDKEVSRDFVDKISSRAAVPGNSRGKARIVRGKKIERSGFATLHDLRRAYGSRWTLKVPAQVLRRMMRHSSIETTLGFYADDERAALQAIWPSEQAET